MIQSWGGGDKGTHIFPKGIKLKVNIVVWLEFELAYLEATVQHLSHHVMGTPHDLIVDTLFNRCIYVPQFHTTGDSLEFNVTS